MKQTGRTSLANRKTSKTKAGSVAAQKVQVRDLDVQKGSSVKGGFIDFGGLQAKPMDSSLLKISSSSFSQLR